jgi:hypothetical protein
LLYRGVLLACVSVLVLLTLAPSANARPRPGARGYDISYPQCGSPLPTHQKFAIVGVNGGLANNANSCLAHELKWAAASPGLTSPPQAPASLYINTADPGPGVSDWPKSGSNRYGNCRGGWSQACAFRYGEERATYSYGLVSASHPILASTAPWWLDLETDNSWATGSTPGYRGLNIAAIRGFMEGLINAGAPAPVGVYSMSSEWKAITGLTARTTAAALGSSPPAWSLGTGTPRDAKHNCRPVIFTGVRATLAQYSSGSFDGDLRCS